MFILLGGIQSLATGFIVVYVVLHRDCYCPSHASRFEP